MKVVILTSGGTIASRYDPDTGGLRPAVSGEDLVAAVPGLTDASEVEVEQFSNIPGDYFTPDLWLELSRRANELLDRPDVNLSEIRGIFEQMG